MTRACVGAAPDYQCELHQAFGDQFGIKSQSCTAASIALNSIIEGYSNGASRGRFSCSLEGLLKDDSGCADVDLLNEILTFYEQGHFEQCEGPTTTQTTTPITETSTTRTTTTILPTLYSTSFIFDIDCTFLSNETDSDEFQQTLTESIRSGCLQNDLECTPERVEAQCGSVVVTVDLAIINNGAQPVDEASLDSLFKTFVLTGQITAIVQGEEVIASESFPFEYSHSVVFINLITDVIPTVESSTTLLDNLINVVVTEVGLNPTLINSPRLVSAIVENITEVGGQLVEGGQMVFVFDVTVDSASEYTVAQVTSELLDSIATAGSFNIDHQGMPITAKLSQSLTTTTTIVVGDGGVGSDSSSEAQSDGLVAGVVVAAVVVFLLFIIIVIIMRKRTREEGYHACQQRRDLPS